MAIQSAILARQNGSRPDHNGTDITTHKPRFKRGFSSHRPQVICDDTVAIAPDEVYNSSVKEMGTDEYISFVLSQYK